VPMAVLSGRLCAERLIRDTGDSHAGSRAYVQLKV
jgi:hypothetical protein